MRKASLLVIPLLLLVVLVVAVAAQIPGHESLPDDVLLRLEQYMVETFPPGSVTIQAAQRAARPWYFGQELSGVVYGDSVHFQTDTGPTRTARANLAALYYPPQEIWCVLLRNGQEEPASYAAVFVGLHVDLYNAGIVVHQANESPQSPEFAAHLSAIGCDLPLPEGSQP